MHIDVNTATIDNAALFTPKWFPFHTSIPTKYERNLEHEIKKWGRKESERNKKLKQTRKKR